MPAYMTRAKANSILQTIPPFDQWLVSRPNTTDFDKELFHKTVAELKDIAENGKLIGIKVVRKKGKNVLIEKRGL